MSQRFGACLVGSSEGLHRVKQDVAIVETVIDIVDWKRQRRHRAVRHEIAITEPQAVKS